MWVNKSQYFIISLVALGIVVALGVVNEYYYGEGLEQLYTWLSVGCFLMPQYYLYRFGTFVHTRWRSGLFLLFSAGILALLARIQNWIAYDYLYTLCYLGVAMLYALYFFISKRRKGMNDWLKLLWVTSNFSLSWLAMTHLMAQPVWVKPLNIALLYFIYIQFRWIEKRRPPEPEPASEWDFERGNFGA